VDVVKGCTSPLTGQPIWVIGAGAVYDGPGLAANLAYGVQAVWVGKRSVASEEAGMTQVYKPALLSVDHGDFVHTPIYMGHPLRVCQVPYIDDWEYNRQVKIKGPIARGIILNGHDSEVDEHLEESLQAATFLIGNVAMLINDILPAQTVVHSMVNDAVMILRTPTSQR
jgi:NAD(P)H-dependent flavin oxidoreductase YrpB (nitropropane dioxygenase family)